MRYPITALCCVAASFVVTTSPVHARDYYYFNKPGVDRQAYLEDRLECSELAGGGSAQRMEYNRQLQNTATNQLWQDRSLTAGQAAAAAGIGGFFGAFLSGAQNRRLQWQIERICLADKGYKRFEIAKRDWKVIEKIDDEETRIDEWFALATTDEPVGEEMYE